MPSPRADSAAFLLAPSVREMHVLCAMEIRRLLVATDFGSEADVAIERATRIARRVSAEVLLLHVCESERGLEAACVAEWADATKRMQAIGEALAERSIHVHPLIVAGSPAEEICEAASHVEADLVILGTRERRGVGRWLLGSVAERVARSVEPAALIVRPEEPLCEPFSRIVVPTDFSRSAERAAEYAQALVAPDGVIEFVHCWVKPSRVGGPEAVQAGTDVGRSLEELGSEWCEKFDGAEHTTMFRQIHESPATGIIERSSSGDCALIAMGTHGYAGVRRFLLGSTAQETLREARCSVLIAHRAFGG